MCFGKSKVGSGFTFTNTGTTGTGFYLESIGRPGILKGWKIDDKLKEEIQEDGLQFNIDPATGNYVYDMVVCQSLIFVRVQVGHIA